MVSPTVEPAARVGQVGPAASLEGGAEVLPGQLGGVGVALAVVGEEVPQRVAQRRCEVVVGAEDEHPGQVEQPAEALDQRADRVLVREVVAGVDHEVGLEVGERGQPAPLHPLVRRQVQVADVQHLERPVPGRQHRHLDPAYDEVAHLDPGGVRQRARARRRHPARRPSRGRAGRGAARGKAGWRGRMSSTGCHNGPSMSDSEGALRTRPDRLDQGARRGPVLDPADGADLDHQRRGRRQGVARAHRRGRARRAHQRVQEAS